MPQQINPSVVRVALVDDDTGFQRAVAEALKLAPDMALVSVSGTLAAGLKLLKAPPVDILIVDLGLPDGSGINLVQQAYQQWPTCNIMVSTTFADESNVMKSLEAGATGYLLKDSSQQNLISELRSLHSGGSPISPLIARKILMRFRPEQALTKAPVKADESCVTLSAREQEVLELITKGFTSNEIAALISVSHHTVLTFIRRIYAKLKVNSKTEAIYEARIQGLLDK
ncbi:response regulator containing a CheY-like receiver domain and an HTH DNA-binding domain protein [Rheinheimera sp. A13L]|uniref:response regulator n=1 Tax=Rheinheimera sp. A13L TaxID=506534 RepID=UPI00021256E7|nr:response regulator transcription factor [Rheinheimera sp. A13L]EGM77401.1 response regulator containing a CheY-like receiver domain and an HTH DNA-binding domain protein [Rheinheimera sp. A13L]